MIFHSTSMMSLVLLIIWTKVVFQASAKTNTDLINPLPLSQGVQITGAAGDKISGISISLNYAGDVNHDGIDDILIAATFADHLGRTDAGIVYVIYGKETAMTANIDLADTLPLSEGFKIFGTHAFENLGISGGYAGDFNNDGIDDIMVGTSIASPFSRSSAGMVWVIYGKAGGMSDNIDLSTLSFSQGFAILGGSASDSLGIAASFAGDVNHDGIDDIIIGAYGADPSGISNAGAAYVIYGVTNGMTSNIDLATDLTTTQGFKIVGTVANGQLGMSVNWAGDVNGDGLSDVIIGACTTTHSSGFTNAGIVVVVYGKYTADAANIDLGTSFSVSQGFQVFGGAAFDYFGISVSTAGDFNADGIDDILVGAYRASPSGRSEAGSVYIIYGVNGKTSNIFLNDPLPLSQGFRIDGGASWWHFGYSSSYVGDVNGDSISDVIIGADLYSPTGRVYAGAAFVVYGKANGMTENIDLSTPLLLSQGFMVVGRVGDYLGTKVCPAGDFNHDGIADIIIGGRRTAPSGPTDSGVVFVLYDPPYCSGVNCVTCSGSKCLKCATDYLLYVGDGKCYTPDTCPAGTTPNATNCVDTLMQALGAAQSVVTQGASMAASAVSLVSFNNPSCLIFSTLAGILQYMQFMSITYPPKLQYLLDQPKSPLLYVQYITEVPEEINNNIPNLPLPDNFEKNGLPSSFLANFWISLVDLLIICSAIVIVCLAEYITRSCQFLNSKFNKLKEMLKWNYLLASFSGCYGDIAFFSSLEFRTDQFETYLEIFSFSVCIMANIALLVASFTMFAISLQLSQQKTLKKLERLKKKLNSYQVVFDNFKSTFFSQQSFLLISCLRFYLFYTILAYLFEYPLAQAILINIQCLLFLAYLIFKRPFNNILDLITAIVLELILEVIHACVLGFAIINQKDPDQTIKAIDLGNVVLGCTFAFLGVEGAYMIIQIIILSINFIKFVMKNLKQKSPTTVTKQAVLKPSETGLNSDQVIIDDRQIQLGLKDGVFGLCKGLQWQEDQIDQQYTFQTQSRKQGQMLIPDFRHYGI